MKYGHNSTTISHSEYDPQTKQLTITFHSGGSYSYDQVAPELYDRFLKADSAGKFFHQYIKSQHKTTKL